MAFLKRRRELLVLFLFANCIVLKAIAGDGPSTSRTNCDIQTGPCTEVRGGLSVTLDILPKPVLAMKDLTFRVTLTGKELTNNPHIDLGMPGMSMGPNRVLMKRVDDSTYEGQGVIVRCPSGRRTWKAVVTLPDAEIVDFVFDVIY